MPAPRKIEETLPAVQQSGSLDAADIQDDSTRIQAQNRALSIRHASIHQDDLYRVSGGKQAFSARAMGKLALAQDICTECVREEWTNKDDLYNASVSVYVRGWPARKKHLQKTCGVTLHMGLVLQRFIVKKIASKYEDRWSPDDVTVDERGRMFPKSKAHQMQLLSYLVDQMTFLGRVAQTKAEKIVNEKLLDPGAFSSDEGPEYTGDDEPPTPPPPPPAPKPSPKAPKQAKEPEAGGDTSQVKGRAHTPPPAGAPETAPDVSFPPSKEELAEHERQTADLGKVPLAAKEPAELDERASLQSKEALAIDAALLLCYTQKDLSPFAARIREAKDKIPAEDYGILMQVFWKQMESLPA